jgi:hypothetical protein
MANDQVATNPTSQVVSDPPDTASMGSSRHGALAVQDFEAVRRFGELSIAVGATVSGSGRTVLSLLSYGS